MIAPSFTAAPFDDRVGEAQSPKQIHLKEWAPHDIALSPQHVSDVLQCPSNLLQIQTLPGGMYRLRSGATIGQLRLGDVDLRILPKYPMPSLLAMLVEVYELAQLTPQLVGYEKSSEIVDLLVQIFLNQVERTVRRGLKRTYLEEEDELVAVRGRIDLRRTGDLHLRGIAKAHCRYEEYTLDGLENGTLLAALEAVARSRTLPVGRRNLAHRIATEFVGVKPIVPARTELGRIRYDRLTLHYHPALELAHLLLESMGITQDFGMVEADGFLLNMNQLFESFVCRRLRKILTPHRVRVVEQKKHPFDVARQSAIKPDMMVHSHLGRRIVADTKYKVGTSPDPEDLYQILSYCRVLKVSHGILVTIGAGTPRRYDVLDGKTTIEVIPVDLDGSVDDIATSLHKLSQRMLQILANSPSARAQD